MPRKHLDQYFTPAWATRILLQCQPNIAGNILEPCSGDGGMADVLQTVGSVWTNDLDPAMPSRSHVDAADPANWAAEAWTHMKRPDWVISNPPFNCCHPIIVGACGAATKGVAMLLRLSYLEPCNNRADFLADAPPSLIVLPRISFTGDGKTDNVTCAWFVWDFAATQTYTRIITKPQAFSLMRGAGLTERAANSYTPKENLVQL